MGRKFPDGETNAVNHPFISVSLFIACIAATVAIISSLCGSLSRKKPEPSSDANEIKENKDRDVSLGEEAQQDPSTRPPSTAGNEMDVAQPHNGEDIGQQPLPPPPGRRLLTGAASCHFRSNSAASTTLQTKLPTSRSMRVFGNGTASRQTSKTVDTYRKKEKKLKHEDSIWKKTIILGEKCKVPDDDDDTILYDEKGNRISTYHPKTAIPLSRQSSNIDSDSIPT